jgi:acetyl esterase/lipase
MLGFALRALSSTVPSRLRHGPLFPGWSFQFEMVTRVIKLRAAALNELPLPERRRQNEEMGAREAQRMRGKVMRSEAPLGGVPGEWFTPAGRTPGRTILYLHGGGFQEGSSVTHGEMIARLAIAADARVYAPNYRLAPEHPHPAQLDDARAVYRALLGMGVGREDLVLVGDSAGGNLVLALLVALRDAGEPLPARAAPLSPWVDLAATGGSLVENTRYDWAAPEDFSGWVKNYAGSRDVRDPLISPLHADLRGLPPLRVEVGTAEMLLDQVRAFAARAREAGIALDYRELPGMVHNCYLMAAFFPQCQAAIDDLGAWLRR